MTPTIDPAGQDRIPKEVVGQPNRRCHLETGKATWLSWEASAGIRASASSVIHVVDWERTAYEDPLMNKMICSIKTVEPAAPGRQSET